VILPTEIYSDVSKYMIALVIDPKDHLVYPLEFTLAGFQYSDDLKFSYKIEI